MGQCCSGEEQGSCALAQRPTRPCVSHQTWPLGGGGRQLGGVEHTPGRGQSSGRAGAGGWGVSSRLAGGGGRRGQAAGGLQPGWSWSQWLLLSGSFAECSLLT